MSTTTPCSSANTQGWDGFFTANQQSLTNRLSNFSYPVTSLTGGTTYEVSNAQIIINPPGYGDNTLQLNTTLLPESIPTDPQTIFDSSFTTAHTVATTATDSQIYMAFVNKSDNTIYLSTSTDGATWSTPATIQAAGKTITTGFAVSLAVFNDALYLLYVGAANYVYYTMSSDEGSSWSTPARAFSSWNQSVNQSVRTAVFTDSSNNSQLYVSMVANPGSDLKYGYVGSFDGTTWSTPQRLFTAFTKDIAQPLPMAAFDDTMYMTIVDSQGEVYLAKGTEDDDGLTWSNPRSTGFFHTFSTKLHPASQPLEITTYNNKLYLSYVDTSNQIYYAYSNPRGGGWPNKPLEWKKQSSSTAVALVAFQQKLFLTLTNSANQPAVGIILPIVPSWPNKPGAILEDYTVTEPVAMAALGSYFYSVFLSDSKVYVVSSSDGANWPSLNVTGQPVQILSDRTITQAVSLTALNDTLYLAFVDDTNKMYIVSSTDGFTWTDPSQATTQSTTKPVAITAYQEMLYLIYVDDNNLMYVATSTDGLNWSLSLTPLLNSTTTQQAVSLTAATDALYLAYVHDSKVYVATSTDGTTWELTTSTAASGDNTTLAPATIAVYNEIVYVAFADNASGKIYTTSYIEGASWATPAAVFNSAYLTPSFGLFNNLLYLSCTSADNALELAASGERAILIIDVTYMGLVSYYSDQYVNLPSSQNSYVYCGTLNNIDPSSTGFTFLAWINTADTTDTQTIFALGNDASLSVGPYGSTAKNYLSLNWGSETASSSDAKQIADGKWHCVAVTIDTSGNVTFYKDGRSTTGSTQLTPNSLSGALVLGLGSNSSNPLTGNVAQTAVWQEALTASQIQQWMNADLSQLTSTNTPTGYWNFTGSNYSLANGATLEPQKDVINDPQLFFYIFDATSSTSNFLLSTQVYKQNLSTDATAVTLIKTAVSAFAGRTNQIGSIQYPTYATFVTVPDASDATNNQLFVEMMLSKDLPPADSSFSVVSFPTNANNQLDLCNYAILEEFALPFIVSSLNGLSSDTTVTDSDFEITTGPPPVLKLVKNITVDYDTKFTFYPVTAIIKFTKLTMDIEDTTQGDELYITTSAGGTISINTHTFGTYEIATMDGSGSVTLSVDETTNPEELVIQPDIDFNLSLEAGGCIFLSFVLISLLILVGVLLGPYGTVVFCCIIPLVIIGLIYIAASGSVNKVAQWLEDKLNKKRTVKLDGIGSYHLVQVDSTDTDSTVSGSF